MRETGDAWRRVALNAARDMLAASWIIAAPLLRAPMELWSDSRLTERTKDEGEAT